MEGGKGRGLERKSREGAEERGKGGERKRGW